MAVCCGRGGNDRACESRKKDGARVWWGRLEIRRASRVLGRQRHRASSETPAGRRCAQGIGQATRRHRASMSTPVASTAYATRPRSEQRASECPFGTLARALVARPRALFPRRALRSPGPGPALAHACGVARAARATRRADGPHYPRPRGRTGLRRRGPATRGRGGRSIKRRGSARAARPIHPSHRPFAG